MALTGMALGIAKLGLLVGAFALAIASVIALHPAYQPAPARMVTTGEPPKTAPGITARTGFARTESARAAHPASAATLTTPPATGTPDHDRYRQITEGALANLRVATGQANVIDAGPGVLRGLVARSLAATPPDSYTDALQAEALFGLTAGLQDDATLGEGDASTAPIIYTVQEGDSLRTIAARFYGDATGFLAIYEANRAILATPDRLRAGQRLVIPGT